MICSEKTNTKGQVDTLSKYVVHKVGILLISVPWILLMNKCSLFVLDILYYLLSGLTYSGINIFTRRRIRRRTNRDFVTCRFHTLVVVSITHAEGSATFVNAQKPQVSLRKAEVYVYAEI